MMIGEEEDVIPGIDMMTVAIDETGSLEIEETKMVPERERSLEMKQARETILQARKGKSKNLRENKFISLYITNECTYRH